MTNTLPIECRCLPRSPFYLRWINRYGGYDHWMFQKRQQYQRTQSNVQTVDPYIASYAEASGTSRLLSKTVEDKVTIGVQNLSPAEWQVLAYIVCSPRVQWYNKEHTEQEPSDSRWVDVIVDKEKLERLTDEAYSAIEYTLLLPAPQLAM